MKLVRGPAVGREQRGADGGDFGVGLEVSSQPHRGVFIDLDLGSDEEDLFA